MRNLHTINIKSDFPDSGISELLRNLSTFLDDNMPLPPPPQLINQGIDSGQRIFLFTSTEDVLFPRPENEPLPTDAEIYLSKLKSGWVMDILCPSLPYRNCYQQPVFIYNAPETSIEWVVGVIVERFGVSPRQCFVQKKNQKKSFFKDFLSIVSSSEEKEWDRYFGNAVYTDLHRLLVEFDNQVWNFNIGYSDVIPGSNSRIISAY